MLPASQPRKGIAMRALRKVLVVTAGVCAASALSLPPAHASGPFEGSWEATDVPDGSHMTLSVHGSGARYAVQLFDESATSVCGGAPATVSGAGPVEHGTLLAEMTLACRPGGNTIRHRITLSFRHDAGTDTLEDGDGIVWHRV